MCRFPKYFDMQILVIKRNDDGTLTLVHDSGSKYDRDWETCVNLEPGHYVVVPRTTGATMCAPSDPKPSHDLYYEYKDRKI